MTSDLLGPLFSSADMRAIYSDTATLGAMLAFEAALARAESQCGIVPSAAAEAIARACDPTLYDMAALGHEARRAGNLAIPLVKALTREVSQADAEAARYVHWGSTSQDVIDTGAMLQLRDALDLMISLIDRAAADFAQLAERHRNTIGAGRTLLQHALPIPFGLRFANYAAALARSSQRLRTLREHNLALQFGGAAGTLASLKDNGFEIGQALSRSLGLPLPDAPWHTQRDRLVEIAAAIGIMTGTCGKIGRDIQLLMQTDVGEASERAEAGRGGSSALPHKRNPVSSTIAVAAATMAPHLVATMMSAQMQELERGPGSWHSEWPTLRALALAASGALDSIVDLAAGLEVDPQRMQDNLDTSHGLVMAESVSLALAAKIGKSDAHHVVEAASRICVAQKRPLIDVLAEDQRVMRHLSREELEAAFDPANYQGAAQAFIDRQIAALRKPD